MVMVDSLGGGCRVVTPPCAEDVISGTLSPNGSALVDVRVADAGVGEVNGVDVFAGPLAGVMERRAFGIYGV